MAATATLGQGSRARIDRTALSCEKIYILPALTTAAAHDDHGGHTDCQECPFYGADQKSSSGAAQQLTKIKHVHGTQLIHLGETFTPMRGAERAESEQSFKEDCKQDIDETDRIRPFGKQNKNLAGKQS